MTDLEEIVKEYFLSNPADERRCNADNLTLLMKFFFIFNKLSNHENLYKIATDYVTNNMSASDLNLQDNDGWTAIMYAARFIFGKFVKKIIKLLICADSDVNIQTKKGSTVLSIYLYNNKKIYKNIVVLFIEAKINLNLQNIDEYTPFMQFISVYNSDTDISILDLFIQNNAAIDFDKIIKKDSLKSILIKNIIQDRMQMLEIQKLNSNLLAENKMLRDELECHPDSVFVDEIKARFDKMKQVQKN